MRALRIKRGQTLPRKLRLSKRCVRYLWQDRAPRVQLGYSDSMPFWDSGG